MERRGIAPNLWILPPEQTLLARGVIDLRNQSVTMSRLRGKLCMGFEPQFAQVRSLLNF